MNRVRSFRGMRHGKLGTVWQGFQCGFSYPERFQSLGVEFILNTVLLCECGPFCVPVRDVSRAGKAGEPFCKKGRHAGIRVFRRVYRRRYNIGRMRFNKERLTAPLNGRGRGMVIKRDGARLKAAKCPAYETACHQEGDYAKGNGCVFEEHGTRAKQMEGQS